MSPELFLRSVNQLDTAVAQMRGIGVCQEGIDIMLPKARHFVFMVRNLDPRGANILKQEMLAVGGEAAISYRAITDIAHPTDCLLFGTERQFGIAQKKLEIQPFGLKCLASDLAAAIRNIGCRGFGALGGLRTDRTLVMGILNVTPDSFSGDGTTDMGRAVEKALEMERDGADIIDIGGESTRPGAGSVDAAREMDRVIPVIRALNGRLKVPISVDSRKPEVVEAALEAGAAIVNLVGGIRETGMAELLARSGAPVILMHMRGEPATMQDCPRYGDVMDDIVSELREQARLATEAGIHPENIALDPGIGFGKTAEHSLEIVRRLPEMRAIGFPIVVGASRKSFIGKVLGLETGERLEGSLAAAVLASAGGASIVRVHDVPETVKALSLADAVLRASAKSII